MGEGLRRDARRARRALTDEHEDLVMGVPEQHGYGHSLKQGWHTQFGFIQLMLAIILTLN